MRGVREDRPNGWLFISSNADTHASLKPVISMWLSIAIRGLLAMGETGFDIRGYREAADARAAELARAPAAPVNTDGPDITDVVTKAIAGLSDRKVQFTYADLLARTVGQLEAKDGVFELARAGIDAAIEREQLIPLDREKGLFTSNIHVLDELAVKALSQEVQRQNHVSVTPDASVVRQVPFSDAVSVLAQDRPVMGIVSGQGGATGQRERVAELTLMAREQGRDVHILAADNRSRDFLAGDVRLAGETVTGKSALQDGTAFIPGGTLIVDQAEKLSLKETISLLDGAMRHNVQVLLSDSGKRSGTGSALTVLKDSGVNTYRWQGGHQTTADIISEPDKGARYSRLAQEFAVSVREGQESVAQISGAREQSVLNGLIRDSLRHEGVLGEKDTTITALTPVWLDSKSRGVRDYYREGMVMERWDPETRTHDRFVIDRVTASSNMLTLKDRDGVRLDLKVSAVDSQWTLFRAETLPVAEGERLAVLGKIPDTRLKGGESITVMKVEDGQLTVQRPGQKTTQTLAVGAGVFDGIKIGHGWVESPGRSVSETAPVVYREYSVCLCRHGPGPAVGQPAVLVLHPPGGRTAGRLDTPVNRQLRHGRSGHAHRQLATLSRTACTGTAGIRGAVGPHGVADEYA